MQGHKAIMEVTIGRKYKLRALTKMEFLIEKGGLLVQDLYNKYTNSVHHMYGINNYY